MKTRILSTLLLASTVSLTACAGGSPNAAQVPASGEAPKAAAPAPDAAPVMPAPIVDKLPLEGSKGGSSTEKLPAEKPKPSDPVAKPVPVDTSGMKYDEEDYIVFQSNRNSMNAHTDDNNIFLYKAKDATIVALPGLNTQHNEINPRVSDNGKYIVFQRSLPVSTPVYCLPMGADASIIPTPVENFVQQDILLYSVETKMINNLQNLNTEIGDEYMPDVSDDGKKIVYIHKKPNQLRGDFAGLNIGSIVFQIVNNVLSYTPPEVHIYDVRSGDDWTVPGATANMPFGEVHWPTMSANGKKIAYSATILPGEALFTGVATDTTGTPTGGSAATTPFWPLDLLNPARIFVYDIEKFKQVTPPFVNGDFSSYNPDLSSDGDRMLFVSNRLGIEDIYEVDFRTGMLDNLQFANVNFADNQHPRYLGDECEKIIFQVKEWNGLDWMGLRIYDRETGELDLLPVINNGGFDDGLRAPRTALP